MNPLLVEKLFRHESRRLVASLARRTGELHLAEEAVQEAMLKALKLWPLRGVPDDPRAWLYVAARNHLVDQVRRRAREEQLPALEAALTPEVPSHPEVLRDDTLALLFACADPELPRSAHLPLMLNVAIGLSSAAIGRALVIEAGAARQRISRAKAHLRELGGDLGLPAPDQLALRVDSVLEAIYGVFSLGHAAAGADVIELDLCEEAIRLVQLVCASERCATPAAHALAALCFLSAARFPARLDPEGAFVSLRDQDRSVWDRAACAAGFGHLDRSRGDLLTRYHLEAGIASCHAVAPSYAETDWEQVLSYYDLLCERHPSPLLTLNRALALAELEGPQAALDALAPLATAPALRSRPHFAAARADLLLRLGRSRAAEGELRRALRAPLLSGPERRTLEARLNELRGRGL